MSVSKDRRELYEDLGAGDRAAVNRAFDKVIASLSEDDIETQGDDRAENLVGAIARYVEECRS